MTAIRAVRWTVVMVVLLFLSLDAGREIYSLWKQPAPLVMDCAAYLKALPETSWVDLKNCTIDYAARQRLHNYDKGDEGAEDDDNYVPVVAPNGGPVGLMLKVSRDEARYLNTLPPDPDAARQARIADRFGRLRAHRDLRGVVRTRLHILNGVQVAIETSGLTLAPNWSVVEEEDPLSLWWTIPFFFLPFLLAGYLGWYFWRARMSSDRTAVVLSTAPPVVVAPAPAPVPAARVVRHDGWTIVAVVAAIVAATSLGFAGKTFYYAWEAPAPVVMQCGDYLRDPPKAIWIDLRDCTLDYDLVRRTFWSKPGLRATDDNYIPVVRAPGEANIVLFLKASKEESDYLNAIPDNPTPAQSEAIAVHLGRLAFHRRIKGLIQTSFDVDNTIRRAMENSHISTALGWKIVEEKEPPPLWLGYMLPLVALASGWLALWLFRRRLAGV